MMLFSLTIQQGLRMIAQLMSTNMQTIKRLSKAVWLCATICCGCYCS